MSHRFERVLGATLWLVVAVMVLTLAAAPVGALSSNEVILFDNTQASCSPGGQGLYLTGDANSLAAWGFNDRASGWKRGSGSWTAYEGENYGAIACLLRPRMTAT